ncbi:MAG: YihY/virulence factor BrkB family protein [Rhodospirillaceae bacterium]
MPFPQRHKSCSIWLPAPSIDRYSRMREQVPSAWWRPSPLDTRRAAAVIMNPPAFALRVLRAFRKNQGLLLAGAVAYYAMLSLVPLLILTLMALSHVFAEERVLTVLGAYLEFVVPGQSRPLIDGLRTFLDHRATVSGFLLASMLFFSSLAFTALENAMSVIFFHRVQIKRRHFLISAILPYLFILFLTTGLIVVTVASGLLQGVGTRNVTLFGVSHSLDPMSRSTLYGLGVIGETLLLSSIYLVMPVGRLSFRHALMGGAVAAALWEITRHGLGWYYATVSQIQLVYGTFATSVGVLLSAEFGALVLLAGAQVIAEYERLEV